MKTLHWCGSSTTSRRLTSSWLIATRPSVRKSGDQGLSERQKYALNAQVIAYKHLVRNLPVPLDVSDTMHGMAGAEGRRRAASEAGRDMGIQCGDWWASGRRKGSCGGSSFRPPKHPPETISTKATRCATASKSGAMSWSTPFPRPTSSLTPLSSACSSKIASWPAATSTADYWAELQRALGAITPIWRCSRGSYSRGATSSGRG